MAHRGGPGLRWALALALLLAGRPAAPEPDAGRRGPGLLPTDLARFRPADARAFDLAHVEPARFAEVLGRDPERVFAFVRDHVAHEAYAGSLRGPRGTLVAMAGNAADRASLLAAMLASVGQKVRFARGPLPDDLARVLAASVFAEPRAGAPASPADDGFARLARGVEQDGADLFARLRDGRAMPTPATPAGVDEIAHEAKDHVWVQASRDGTWVDLDPSFSDARPGTAFAEARETLLQLPEPWFHRVTLRVEVEEAPVLAEGDGAVSLERREVLRWEARSSDLGLVEIGLSHQPENWKGPATDVASAVAAAVERTGRVRPVLLVGAEWKMGEPFRPTVPKPPGAGGGIGGIGGMLGGEGTRKPVPVVTAEALAIDLVGPDGRMETVVRDLYDLIGPARRGSGRALTMAEVREAVSHGPDPTHGLVSILLSTGRILDGHVARTGSETADAREGLRAMALTLQIAADATLPWLSVPGRTAVRFHPDRPRVQIAEINNVHGTWIMSLDLRRNSARVLASGERPAADAFTANVVRGVIEGNVERYVIDASIAPARAEDDSWLGALTTSTVFEAARGAGVASRLLGGVPAATDPLAGLGEASPDARVRLANDVRNGALAFVPEKAVPIEGRSRLAWWRVDPRTGETVAVTEAGLHGNSVEVHVTTHVVGTTIVGFTVTITVGGTTVSFPVSIALFAATLDGILGRAGTVTTGTMRQFGGP